jgi:hypothetical protein
VAGDQRAGTHRFADYIRKCGQVAIANVELADSRGGVSAESPQHGDTEVDQ